MALTYEELGTLRVDPGTTTTVESEIKKRNIRERLYEETPSERLEASPFAKYMLRTSGKPIDNTEFEVWMRKFDPNYTLCLGAYTDSACTTAVSASDTAAGTTIYLKFAAEDYPFFIVDEARLLCIDEDYSTLNVGVAAVALIDDTTDYTRVTVKTLRKDAGVLAAIGDEGKTCTAAMLAIASAEMGTLPESFYRDPTRYKQFSQIFKEAASISGTEANAGNIFNMDKPADMERLAIDRFNMRFDRSAWFGWKYDGTGVAGVQRYGQNISTHQRSSGGFEWALTEHVPENVITVPAVTTYNGETYTGHTWAQGGWDFLQNLFTHLGMYAGAGTTLDVWCGIKAYRAIQEVLEAQTSIQVTTNTKDTWGFNISKIEGLTCDVNLHKHKDWSLVPAWQRNMAVIRPENCSYIPFKGRDLSYVSNASAMKGTQNAWVWVDGMKSGWFMEGGFAWQGLASMAMVRGVGESFHS